MNQPTGRREVGEAILTAFLSALAATAGQWLVADICERVEAARKRRKRDRRRKKREAT